MRAAIENQTLNFAVMRDLMGLEKLLKDLTMQRKKLDAWFDKYIDKFDRQMDPADPKTAVWVLYHKKFSEYEELNGCITTVTYYRDKVKKNV